MQLPTMQSHSIQHTTNSTKQHNGIYHNTTQFIRVESTQYKIQFKTIQDNTKQSNTRLHKTVPDNDKHDNTTSYKKVQAIPTQHYTIQCITIRYTQDNTIQHNTIQTKTTDHDAVQCNTVQLTLMQHKTNTAFNNTRDRPIHRNTIPRKTTQYNT